MHLYTSGAEGINLGIQNSERYWKIQTDGGLLTFNDVSAGDLARMTIDTSGNVGIGVADAATLLHVRIPADGSVMRMARNGICEWDWKIGNTTAYVLGGVSGDLELVPLNGNMTFSTGTADRLDMRIGVAGMTLGKGISFNSDTAAANQLDDYEEGYHVPTITGSTSGSWTLSSYNNLAYTKIGRVVHIQGYLAVSGESSPSGQIQISLPFAVASLTDDSESASITVSMRSHGGSDIYNLTGVIVNEGYIRLLAVNGSGSATWLDEGDIDDDWNIRIGGSYITSA